MQMFTDYVDCECKARNKRGTGDVIRQINDNNLQNYFAGGHHVPKININVKDDPCMSSIILHCPPKYKSFYTKTNMTYNNMPYISVMEITPTAVNSMTS